VKASTGRWGSAGTRWDLKLGRFEAMDLFPSGKDVAANIGNVGYNGNTLRGRKSDGRLHAALGLNASSSVRFELGLITEKQTGASSVRRAPVVQFVFRPLDAACRRRSDSG